MLCEFSMIIKAEDDYWEISEEGTVTEREEKEKGVIVVYSIEVEERVLIAIWIVEEERVLGEPME